MRNLSLSFNVIVSHWERKRLLFNVVWVVSILLLFLVQYLEDDSNLNPLSFGFLLMIVASFLALGNIAYCCTWLLNYLVLFMSRRFAEWLMLYGFVLVMIPPYFLLLFFLT